ncbi:MAG: ATP-binding protein [Defluviitaleaceae bacterium]|nr:ATP-binding protein [Defluviitaleaceae bacterium]
MIPLKLEKLLEGRVVESDRVEYKKGWNPNETIPTICAYANDWSNTNGGYIVIGIAEKDGRPILSPEDLPVNTLDKIQQELIQYCKLITPGYTPQIELVEYQGKQLIYLWCSGGDAGLYQAPANVFDKKKQLEYWIKPASVKTTARGSEKFELYNKFNSVLFDDRVNRDAKISDIKRGHLEDFLNDSQSSLAADIDSRPNCNPSFIQLEDIYERHSQAQDSRNHRRISKLQCVHSFDLHFFSFTLIVYLS